MASTLTVPQAADYYAGLLAYQYRDQPNAVATARLLSSCALGQLFALQVQEGFNLETAIGEQLDIIGKYVGIPRNIGDPSALPFFGYWDTTIVSPGDQNVNGYQDSTDNAVNAGGLYFQSTSQGARNTDLTDDAYRFMIKMKIALNSSDSTLASIDALLMLFFNGAISVVDNEDMTLTYYYSQIPVSTFTLEPYLPRPMGCGITLSPFSASVSPTSTSGTIPMHAIGVCTADDAGVISVTGGVGPFSYSWENVYDYGNWAGYPSYCATPNASSTLFQRYFPYGGVYYSGWRCRVVDSNGAVAVSDTIAITFHCLGPSP